MFSHSFRGISVIELSGMCPERRRKQPKEVTANKCTTYCRKLTAFLFSHLGLTSLVICYSVIGAVSFSRLETDNDKRLSSKMTTERDQMVKQLWTVTLSFNILYKENWTRGIEDEIKKYQKVLVKAVKDGYDAKDDDSNQWSLPGAFLYSLTVITTIGYGNIAPKTPWGKIVTIVYAIIGIPLMFFYLTNIGNGMAKGFKYIYSRLCISKRHREKFSEYHLKLKTHQDRGRQDVDAQQENVVTIPVHWCLLLIGVYIAGGGALFSAWENWSYLDGVYFCFITLSTIGFGDLVPGDNVVSDSGSQAKLVISSIYLLGGMALIAMCFNLVQEEVVHRMKNLGRRMGIISKKEET